MKIASIVKFLAAAFTSLSFCLTAMAQADEARAKKIISGSCFLCHGAEGDSSSEVFPRLAGQHHEYIAKQLANFKSGARKSTAMRDMELSDLIVLCSNPSALLRCIADTGSFRMHTSE